MTPLEGWIIAASAAVGAAGVISMGLWRLTSSVTRVAGKLDHLSYRIEQVERELNEVMRKPAAKRRL